MGTIKLTTWNVEWADDTLNELDGAISGSAESKQKKKELAQKKIAAIRAEIAELAPDILFVCEGPAGEQRARRYFDMVAPDHDLVIRGDASGDSYGISGRQWLWFLVRKPLVAKLSPELVPVTTWQAFVRDESEERHKNGKWLASMPRLIRDANIPGDLGRPGPHELTSHKHARHPQVLRFRHKLPGQALLTVEIIGVHLKSKRVDPKDPALKWHRPPLGPNGEPPPYEAIVDAIKRSTGYMIESVRARAKLTTEAMDVRYYIARRFAQEPDPAILLVGDVNDGPGKELIEEWFMLHDLIGNLQGDIFEAKEFLNHALFDFDEELRWSARFEDKVDPRRNPHILIDHVMFTQRLTGRDKGGLRVMPKAGLVEHVVHERVSSLLPSGVTTSDHRPASVTMTEVDQSGDPVTS
jgi:hypothetical protein